MERHSTRGRADRIVIEPLESRQLLSTVLPGASTPAAALTATTVTPTPSAAVATGVTIHVEATDTFAGPVGTLKGVENVATDFHNLHAWIAWGDGRSNTQATFVRDTAGLIHVLGAHAYKTPGTYAITATVYETPNLPPGQPNPFMAVIVAEIHSTADVVEDKKTEGITIHATAGEPFHGSVGSFEFLANLPPVATAGATIVPIPDVVATINWGDGTTSPGVLAHVGDDWTVLGTHTYEKSGTFAVKTTVIEHYLLPAGSTTTVVPPDVLVATITSTAVVAPALPGTGVALTEVATQPFTATLGTFRFANVDFLLHAQIHWGDGTTSDGTVKLTSLGTYEVLGTHTYAKTGLYQIDVDVFAHLVGGTLPGTQIADIDSTADVKGRA